MAHLLDILLNAFFELLPAILEYMGIRRRLRDIGDTVPIAQSSHEQQKGVKGKFLS